MNAIIQKLKDYREIVSNLVKLSLPILGGNVAQLLVGLADNVVAGHYSTLALGAISVASAIIMTVTIGAIGLILSISPVISNFRGKNIPTKRYFKLTILFAVLVSLPFFLIVELIIHNINLIGLDPAMVTPVKEYMEICVWTLFPAVIFTALKEFLQAWEKVVFANLLMLLMVVLNIVLNYALTFGFDWSFIHIKAFGLIGIAVATLISKTVSGVLLILYCLPLFKDKFCYSKDYLKDLFKVGLPISASIFFEFLGFNLTAVLIGRFSALFAAVHNIILCIANMSFMFVLSFSSAASIKIGFYNGKGDKLNIKRYSIVNVLMSVLICLITFVILSNFHRQIVWIFSSDTDVLYWCEKILKIVMCFLFFDGIQASCVGILKGLKDTKIIMFAMLFGYLFIAIPIGSYIAFTYNYVLQGYWGAIAVALFVIAAITAANAILDIRKIPDNNAKAA